MPDAQAEAPGLPDRARRRFGLISDIHANLHALRAVLDQIDRAGVDCIYCCGDVVGYGPFPNECCDILRDRAIPTLAGNHDYAALGLTTIEYFNEVAKRAVQWTRQQLRPDNAEFLRHLPLTLEEDDFLLVHASPVEPREWNYVLTLSDAREAFRRFSRPLCFIGHSHQPFIVRKKGGDLVPLERPSAVLEADCRYLVNVGSVGQPRDQNQQASYALYDRALRTVEIQRCSYDVAATQAAIRDCQLPLELGDRLAHGW